MVPPAEIGISCSRGGPFSGHGCIEVGISAQSLGFLGVVRPLFATKCSDLGLALTLSPHDRLCDLLR